MPLSPKMDEDRESNTSSTCTARSKTPRHHLLIPFCVTFLIASTISLAAANYYSLFTHSFFAISTTHNNPPALPQYTNCGTSPSEARARGCSFDLLSFSWQTRECYDSELINAFLTHPDEPWTYYTSSYGNETMSIEVAAQGEVVAYVNWEYHVVHCTYMYMLMHRAYARTGYIDSHTDSWAHTRHCQVVSLERSVKPETINVEGKLRYPECRRVSVGKPIDWLEDHETAFAAIPPHVSR